VFEFDQTTGAVLSTTDASLPTPLAPHDFVITDSWYVFMLNAMALDPLPFVAGLCGPVEALRTTGVYIAVYIYIYIYIYL